MKFAHLLDAVFNRPLLITPAKAETIAAIVLGRAGVLADQIPDGSAFGIGIGGMAYNGLPAPVMAHPDHPTMAVTMATPDAVLAPDANRFIGTNKRANGGYGLTRVQDGIALITVDGSLVNRGAWIGSYSGLTSYEGLSAQVREAAADPEVRAIALDINSPGGEATGMFSLAETIRAARDQKPVVAIVNDMAASAAYGIASAANEIVVTPTSIVGSIGVVMMHLDRSGELSAKGIRPTLVHAGAHKVDGHPFGPLSEEVRARLQADVDTFYARFLETVEAGRGQRTTAARARATEARTFIGADAITAGLADRVGTLDAVLSDLARRRPAATGRTQGKMTMDNETGAPAASNAGFTQAQMDEAVTRARAEATDAAYARVSTILRAEEAKGREPQAMTIALDMRSVSAEDAVKLLATSPKAAAVQSIADRSASTEVGASTDAAPTKPAASAVWGKAVAQANARFQ